MGASHFLGNRKYLSQRDILKIARRFNAGKDRERVEPGRDG